MESTNNFLDEEYRAYHYLKESGTPRYMKINKAKSLTIRDDGTHIVTDVDGTIYEILPNWDVIEKLPVKRTVH
jgi:hypothetical protein